MANLILCRINSFKKVWVNNTGADKSERAGRWRVYENIELHGQSTLYQAGL